MSMQNWKRRLLVALRSCKFSFSPVDGKFPDFDETEFEDFASYVSSVVFEIRRAAFFTGYKHGSTDQFLDLKSSLKEGSDFVMMEGIPPGAWKRWDEEERVGG